MSQRIATLCAALALLACAAADAGTYRWQDVERVVAVGDIHGAYDELVAIMQGTGVIDEGLHWSGGKTHFVSVGDIPDRGPRSRAVIELFMRLQGEARAAGGQLHVLLGNHDVMNLTGDLRYVSRAEYASFSSDEPAGLRDRLRAAWQAPAPGDGDAEPDSAEPPLQASAEPGRFDDVYPPGYFGHLAYYAPDGVFGRWLLDQPLAIVINDTLFVHGGLSRMQIGRTLEQINADVALIGRYAAAWQQLQRAGVVDPTMSNAARLAAVRTAAAEPDLADAAQRYLELEDAPVLGVGSTTWYRGTAYCHEYAELPTTQAVLDGVDAQRVAFGHTPTVDSLIASRMNGRVLMIDTGMLRAVYEGQPSALVIEDGQARAWYADSHQFAAIEPPPRRVGPRPARLTDDDIERILREGEIVKIEDIGAGISKPRRVTLRDGDVTIRAAFVTINESAGGWVEIAGERIKGPADRFRYNIAAYKLDRLLGLNMVPVAVEREIDGRPGSLVFWIEHAINDRQRTEQGLSAGGWCSLADQYNLTYVWDSLIFNLDRSRENLLYTTSDWMVWLIDHTRAFSASRGRPPLLRDQELTLSSDLEAALRRLDKHTLKAALDGLLSDAQIRALLKRRDDLLRDWRDTRRHPSGAGG